jgi:hypothetical protein
VQVGTPQPVSDELVVLGAPKEVLKLVMLGLPEVAAQELLLHGTPEVSVLVLRR